MTQLPPTPFSLEPIGLIHSCFKEKFGIPRQPGLAPEAKAILALYPPYNAPEAVTGLDQFSHIWLIFIFHQSQQTGWKATVRPPRLGGNQRLGVFATRSMFRPNPIGLSAVRLDKIEQAPGQIHLHLSGIDLLDGTPVLDIKPYLPYADALPDAVGGFAAEIPTADMVVHFTPEALAQCEALATQGYANLPALIIQMLQLDPRPAYYKKHPQKDMFGFRLYEFEVKWRVEDEQMTVLAVEPG